jgi:hypothetical protein
MTKPKLLKNNQAQMSSQAGVPVFGHYGLELGHLLVTASFLSTFARSILTETDLLSCYFVSVTMTRERCPTNDESAQEPER